MKADKFNESEVEVLNGRLDDLSCEVKIHLSDLELDGGPRIIIKYMGEPSKSAEHFDYEDGEDFILHKTYSIPCNRDELLQLRDALSLAIKIWPMVGELT